MRQKAQQYIHYMKDVLNLVSCPVSSLLLSPPFFWGGNCYGFFFLSTTNFTEKIN